MRIAHVVRQYYPSVGGFEEVVKNLCKQQLLAGHKPYVVTLNRYFKDLDNTLPDFETIEGIEVIRIPFIGSTRYPVAPSVLKHIKDADIVHVHAIDFFYDFLALTKILHRKKMVVTTHGGFFHTAYASRLKKIFFNTVTRFSSCFYHKVIASSDNDGQIFSNIVKSPKLVTIENGVDIDKLFVKNKTIFPPTLLYFGRWSENKGIFEALTLFKHLVQLDQNTPWQLMIAGRPYDLDAKQITDKVKELDLVAKVSIVENPDTDELRELTLKASYFISMSKFEGFGIAPIEAMSAGLTPVLSAIPPFRKLIEQVGEGVVINNINDVQVIKLMQHYQSKAFNSNKMQAFVQRYAWAGVNEQYMESYQ